MTEKRPIEPADCYARVARIRGELELLRLEMGRPADAQSDLGVTGAQPREVYFVALGMFRKVDRLCFEHTGEQGTLPYPPPLADLKPADVLTVLDAVLERVNRVKSTLGLSEHAAEPAREPARTPSDVFRAIVAANRQLNLLLEQPFSPADVYQQVSLAGAYAASLRAHASDQTTVPTMPAFARRKRPADCYRKLGDAVDRVEILVARAGLQMLDLTVGEVNAERVTPSDVYDLASLLVAELAYLHAQIPGLAPVIIQPTAPPGRRLPSHVFQLASLVEEQLAAVEKLTEKNAGALRPSR